MSNGETVKRGTIEVTYVVVSTGTDDDPIFVWYGPGGYSPDEWFDTAEEAEDDVRRYYGE
jgi:hypothetical protein